MINSKFFTAARLGRVLTGGAALAIAATISSIAPATALGQGKVGYNGGSGCTNFSTFTYDAANNQLTVNCTVTAPVSGPSSYSVSPSSLNVTRDTDIQTVITRTGGGSVAEALTLTHAAGGISGWNFNGNFTGSQAINFAAGEMSKTLNFYSGPTDGWLTFTLAAVSSTVGSTASGSQTFNVAGAKVVTPPPGTIPGCATTATYSSNEFTVTGQKFTYSLKPGETAATRITAKAGLQTDVSTSDTVNTPPGADHEITVSKCPGDFTSPVGACRLKSLYKGGVIRTTTTGFPDYNCQLIAGDTYYMNIRQVAYDNSLVNSCTVSSCEIKVQVQGF